MSTKMRFVKGIVLLTALVLTLNLVGCANTSEKADTQSNTQTETSAVAQNTTAEQEELPLYTIKYLRGPASIATSDETAVGKIIKDKFNIVFEFEPYTGDWKEKTALMLAAGDYPEILNIEYDDIVAKYINAGALLNLDELMDKYGPDFKKRYINVIPYWRLPSTDGKTYKYEMQDFNKATALNPPGDMLVRSDVLEAMGWPKLSSEDSWVEFLKAAMQKFPETDGKKSVGLTVPFAESWGVAGLSSIMFEKGKYTNAAGNKSVIFDSEKNEYTHYLLNPYVKASYKFFNRLHREGILDRESFTDFYAQMMDKTNSGRAISVFYCTWIANEVNTVLRKADKSNMEYVAMPIHLNEQIENNDKRMVTSDQVNPFRSMVITKNAKDPERIMQLLNWVASEEGQVTLGWGIEGTHYNVVDGKRVVTDEFKNGYLNTQDYLIKEGIGLGVFSFLGLTADVDANGQAYAVEYDPVVRNLLLSDRQKEVLSKYGWKTDIDAWFSDKNKFEIFETGMTTSVTVSPDSEEGKIEEKIIQQRVKNVPLLILAKDDAEFEKVWENVVKEYEALNPQVVIDQYNKIYKERADKLEGLKMK